MAPLTPNPYSEFTTLYFRRRAVGLLEVGEVCCRSWSSSSRVYCHLRLCGGHDNRTPGEGEGLRLGGDNDGEWRRLPSSGVAEVPSGGCLGTGRCTRGSDGNHHDQCTIRFGNGRRKQLATPRNVQL